MKELIKVLAIATLFVSTNSISANEYPLEGTLYADTYKPTIKELNLCSDWACTAPFNMFTGSALVEVKSNEEPNFEFDLVVPDSGTYGYLQLKISKIIILNGYGKLSNGKWCATNSIATNLTSSTVAVAASVENSRLNDEMFKTASDPQGNGIDPFGRIKYGLLDGQTSIGGGYSDRVEGVNTSDINKYTFVLKTDSLTDSNFYITTVLQGGHDFGSDIGPNFEFGISINKMIKFNTKTCVSKGAEPVFDFIIQ
jgi:hypothetical protein